jgi:hypothetical protein
MGEGEGQVKSEETRQVKVKLGTPEESPMSLGRGLIKFGIHKTSQGFGARSDQA